MFVRESFYFVLTKFLVRRRITDADKAILDLKALRRKLEGQKRRIDGLIEKEEKVARELLAGGKRDRAKLALKRKRLQQGALEKYEAWSFHVEGVVSLRTCASPLYAT